MEIRRTGLFGMALLVVLTLAGAAQAHMGGGPRLGPHHFHLQHLMPSDNGVDADGPGWLKQLRGGPHPYSGTSHTAFGEHSASPYMMNYADEVAQKLGFGGGNANIIPLRMIRGGSLGLTMMGGRPMLSMQWHFG